MTKRLLAVLLVLALAATACGDENASNSSGESPAAGGSSEPSPLPADNGADNSEVGANGEDSAASADGPEPLAANAPAASESQQPEPAEDPGNDPDSSAGGADESAGGADEVRGSLEFSDCGKEYLCARLTVPADHGDPDGPKVELAVGMVPAGDPSRRVGYLFANPGGPGGGMQGFLDYGADLSADLLERFDIIGWDPRAVGDSVPSNCEQEAIQLHLVDPLADSPSEQAELDRAARAVAEACSANLGDLVGHVGTSDTVADMDAIRRALGAEEISYIGFSYGTTLGLLYAEQYGEHLRAAVIDSVTDPALAPLEQALAQATGFNRSVEAIFAWCASDSSCAVADDPAETYFEFLEQVNENPLTDQAGELVLGPARTILAAVVATYSSEFWPVFFEFLAEAIAGDGTSLARLGELYTVLADLGAFVSINCTDSGAVTRAELAALADELEEAAGLLGRSAVVSALPCEYWPVASGSLPVGPISAPKAPPILVLGNRSDNASPYEWATAVAEQLRSGVLISYDGHHHGSYGFSDCVTQLVDDYLLDLTVPDADVDCSLEGVTEEPAEGTDSQV